MRGDVRTTPQYCAIGIAMEVHGGRWKLAILQLLLPHGTLRFGELRRALPRITQRVLTRQLREVEADGLAAWGQWYLDGHGSPERVRAGAGRAQDAVTGQGDGAS